MDARKVEQRKKEFMAGMDLEDQRSRREVFSVELRRQKRNELANKRRLCAAGTDAIETEQAEENLELEEIDPALATAFPQLMDISLSPLERLSAFKDLLSRCDLYPDVYLSALTTVRRALSRESNPPLVAVSRLGFIPLLLKFADLSTYPAEIVYEATWALCNLASGPRDISAELVSLGAIDTFVKLIDPRNPGICEHTFWALGNIAGDCAEYRDLMINAKEHEAISALVAESGEVPVVLARVMGWTVCSLLRGSPPVSLPIVRTLLPTVARLAGIDDTETRREVLWALSYITDLGADGVSLLFSENLAWLPIYSLKPSIFDPQSLPQALRTIGNVISESDSYTDRMMDLGVLDALEPFLCYPTATARKEAMWTLSNIAAGTIDQIQRFLDHSISQEAVKRFADSDSFVRKEASWTFLNVAKKGELLQVQRLLDLNLCFYLKATLKDETELVFRSVETVDVMLQKGAEMQGMQCLQENPVSAAMEATGCLVVLEALVSHQNQQIAERVAQVLKSYIDSSDFPVSTPKVLSHFDFEMRSS